MLYISIPNLLFNKTSDVPFIQNIDLTINLNFFHTLLVLIIGDTAGSTLNILLK